MEDAIRAVNTALTWRFRVELKRLHDPDPLDVN
jgi:hypothetical protein